MTNIDDLERLAKAATPGPWEYREHDGSAAVCNTDGWVEAILPSGTQENADAAYCAAANPAAVLALIAEVRALRTRLEIDPRHSYDGIYCRDETIRQLEGEVRALREDKARLDFYEANLNSDVDRDGVYSVWLGRGWGDEFTGNTFREAIDAARKEKA